MKKTNKNRDIGMALGMCFGVSIGTALGSSLGNLVMGPFMGMCIGMVIGIVLGSLKDKKVNKQIEENCYTIKDIKENNQKEKNKEYIITIINKLGEESVVIVPKGQMEEKNFSKGDEEATNDKLQKVTERMNKLFKD